MDYLGLSPSQFAKLAQDPALSDTQVAELLPLALARAGTLIAGHERVINELVDQARRTITAGVDRRQTIPLACRAFVETYSARDLGSLLATALQLLAEKEN